MPRLPAEILEIIDFYVDMFVTAESRPSLHALRRLVRKSNYDIKVRSMFFSYFYNAISLSLRECYATSLLGWLVENDDELLWLPQYKQILGSSYYVRLVHLPCDDVILLQPFLSVISITH